MQSTITTEVNFDMEQAIRIAGAIVMADQCGAAMKSFRKSQGVRQAEVARVLEIYGSVLSDYEAGRRPSPGAHFIKKFVVAVMQAAAQRQAAA